MPRSRRDFCAGGSPTGRPGTRKARSAPLEQSASYAEFTRHSHGGVKRPGAPRDPPRSLRTVASRSVAVIGSRCGRRTDGAAVPSWPKEGGSSMCAASDPAIGLRDSRVSCGYRKTRPRRLLGPRRGAGAGPLRPIDLPSPMAPTRPDPDTSAPDAYGFDLHPLKTKPAQRSRRSPVVRSGRVHAGPLGQISPTIGSARVRLSLRLMSCSSARHRSRPYGPDCRLLERPHRPRRFPDRWPSTGTRRSRPDGWRSRGSCRA